MAENIKQVALIILVTVFTVTLAIAEEGWLRAKQSFFTEPGQAVDLQRVFLGLPFDILGADAIQLEEEILEGRTRIIQIRDAQGVVVHNALRWDRPEQEGGFLLLLEPRQRDPNHLMTRVFWYRDNKLLKLFLLSATPGKLEYCNSRDLTEPETEHEIK